jgi:hypothetical protein
MSKTIAILLAIALFWATAWAIAGYFMGQAGVELLAQAEHVSTPATSVQRGAEVRVEGTIADGPSVVAPFSEKPCLAALTNISLVSHYRDIHDKPATDSRSVGVRRVGPAELGITVGDARLALPLELWVPNESKSEHVDAPPARLRVTEEEIAAARERLHAGSTRFVVSESTIDAGTRVFVVGRLEDRDGALRLEADPVLGHVELFPGTQDELVRKLRGSGGGLRIAGWILGAGVGPLPLAILGLVLLVRWRKRAALRPGLSGA